MFDIKLNHTVTPEQIGYNFARADSKTQGDVLYWIASELQHVHSKDYSPYAVNFCFQAREIAEEKVFRTIPTKRDYLITILEDLVEHLKEVRDEQPPTEENDE